MRQKIITQKLQKIQKNTNRVFNLFHGITFALLMLFAYSTSQAQTLTAVPHPSGGSGYGDFMSAPIAPFTFNGKAYILCADASSNYQLAEWNGTTLTLIAHPSGGTTINTGVKPILFNGNMYLSYRNASYKNQLAKFDGTNITLIANNTAADVGYAGNPVVFNNELYIKYTNSNFKSQLAKYSGTGTTLTYIANANTTDAGYYGNPIVFNNELYISYLNANNKYQLTKYNGTAITLINNANTTDVGYVNYPFVFNNELYIKYQNANNKNQLAKYSGSGSAITLIDNAYTTDAGYQGLPILFNNELYIQYLNANSKYQLAKYGGTGTTLTYIDNANTTDNGYYGNPIVFNNELYIRYYNSNSKTQLAKYSGTGTPLTYINNANNADAGYNGEPIVFNNELFIPYSTTKNQLAKYSGTGTSLTYIANANITDYGYNGYPLVSNNALYIKYQDASNKGYLAKYNGSSITVYPNSDAGFGYQDFPIVYNNQILVRYWNPSFENQLAYFNTCVTNYDTINQSICAGSSYIFNGVALTSGGTYLDTLENIGGCDSILTLNLTVNTPSTWYLDADNDGYYVSTQSACSSPGAGYTSTMPTGGSGDCDDNNPVTTTKLSSASCGSTLIKISDAILADSVTGATSYKFRLTRNGSVVEYIRPNNRFYLSSITIQPHINYDSTYQIEVAAEVGGVYGAYCTPCTVHTPVIPFTKIKASQCGATLSASTTTVVADAVAYAEGYRFEVSSGSNTQIINTTSSTFALTQISNYSKYNATYKIKVAVKYNGAYNAYGDSCYINMPTLITRLQTSQCGITVATLKTNLAAAASSVGTQEFTFKVIQGNTENSVVTTNKYFNFTQLPAAFVHYGTTYKVLVKVKYNDVYGPFGDTCTVTTPLPVATKVVVSQCGATLGASTTSISANAVAYADGYRFEVSAGGNTQVINTTSNSFALTQINNFSKHNATYKIRVAVKYNNNYNTYGDSCNVSTPTLVTRLQLSQCGITLTSLGTNLAAAASSVGTQEFTFKVIQGSTENSVVTTNKYFNFTQLPTAFVQSGTTYKVLVKVKYNGVYGPFGDTCTVTTPGLGSRAASPKVSIGNTSKDLNTGVAVNELAINLSPNPASTIVKIDYELPVEMLSSNAVISLMDMTGKRIKTISLEQLDQQGSITLDLNEMNNGVYLVAMKVANKEVVRKVVIQK